MDWQSCWDDEGFINGTIKGTDAYLSGEAALGRVQAFAPAGGHEGQATAHIESWREMPLLDQAEYMRWSAEVAARDAEEAERDALLDAEYNDYWAAHCPAHGEGLQPDGTCASCEGELLEERRQDA